MLKFAMVLVIVLLPVLCVAQALSPDFLSPTSYDARARAMGRTGITTATGSNAIFYNPANMGMITGKTLEGGLRVHLGSAEDDGFMWDPDVNVSYDGSYKFHPKITNLSFAMPYQPANSNLKFVFGIGYNTHLDLGRKMEKTAEATFDGEPESVTFETEFHGGLNTISPSAAVNIDDKYYVGLTLNKSVMKGISINEKIDYSSANEDDEEYEVDADLSSGMFFTLGGSAKFTPEFTVGFMYRSGFQIDIENIDVKWTEGNESGSGEGDDEEWEVPAILGIGASFQVSPTVLLAAEYQNRAWSDVEYKVGGDKEDSDIDNGACYRAGVEFDGPATFRFGFFSDALLISDIENGEVDGPPKSMTGITAGVGVVSNNITFDFFGEYAGWSYSYEYSYWDGNQTQVKSFDYKEKHYSLGMSVSVAIQ